MIGIAMLVLSITILAYIIKWIYNRSKYWEKKGIKCLPGLPLFGNCLPMALNKKNIGEIMEDIYKAFPDEPVIGYYEFLTPRLLIRDNELVQKVLVKDFGHFVDHGFEVNEEKNPLDNELLMMTGNKWRALRTKMAPLFTSGKLKSMYDVINEVGDGLLEYLDKNKANDIDIREAMSLFSMDIIGSAAFGINPGVLKNPESEFRAKGKEVSDPNWRNLFRIWFFFLFPQAAKYFGFSFQQRSVTNYFCNIIRNAIDYRKKNDIQRYDFIQMMMQLKEKGNIEIKTLDSSDDYLKNELNDTSTEILEITDDLLMAQAISFLAGGFDSTALLLAYAMLEISQKSEIQDALREEIMEKVKLNGGLTYEALRNMKYLEQTIKETQRFYPLMPFLPRVCTKSYTLPNGFTIEKGEYVYIPMSAIHMDPTFYPEPKSFKPERFTEPPKPGTFLPFGEGPRMCIAMRYAMLVVKYGLALIFLNYRTKLSPSTKLPVLFLNRAFGNLPDQKILLNIEKINKQ
ncbi:probable cytochrome P450 6d5 [Halyomorpha halys]|uniref:probable cytochrome P450 6d5 n=1 Tax=Halyomorpha halys TaxID=286706 RepID=UPI0006D4E379|nr:probable cytochrome P450 6d5 [Halyomorpha halys]XP_024219575.1 probable cytochrome P450 6d5 [Halyomorpha halys]